MQGCRIGKHPIVPISWEYARLKRFEAREVAAVDEEQIVADTLFVSRASMELKRRFKFERSTQRAKLSDSRYPPCATAIQERIRILGFEIDRNIQRYLSLRILLGICALRISACLKVAHAFALGNGLTTEMLIPVTSHTAISGLISRLEPPRISCGQDSRHDKPRENSSVEFPIPPALIPE